MEKHQASTPPARLILRDPVHFLAFGFGSGLSPKAPGTAGTLAAVPLVYFALALPLWAYVFLTLVIIIAGVWICDNSSKRLGVHDHPGIVWDEIAGLFITLLAAPAGLIWLAVGFVLFRFFDILKPWPIGWLDRQVGGGLGIMIDDVLAGVYALICLQLLALLLL